MSEKQKWWGAVTDTTLYVGKHKFPAFKVARQCLLVYWAKMAWGEGKGN
jgi:hypothetical protein